MPRRRQHSGDENDKNSEEIAPTSVEKPKRAPPLSENERLRLTELIKERKDAIMSKDGKASANQRKTLAWKKVTDRMNGPNADYKRTVAQIKTAWDTIATKCRADIAKYDKAVRQGIESPDGLSVLAMAVQDIYGADSVALHGIDGFQSGDDPNQALASLRYSYSSFDAGYNHGSPSSLTSNFGDIAAAGTSTSRENTGLRLFVQPNALTRPGIHSYPVSVERPVDSDAFSENDNADRASRAPSVVESRVITPHSNTTVTRNSTATPQPAPRKRRRVESSVFSEEKDQLMCEVLKLEKEKLAAETQYYKLATKEKKLLIAQLTQHGASSHRQGGSHFWAGNDDSNVSY